MVKLGKHEDERGVIQDLFGPVEGVVTRIFTKSGAIRGNHVHYETTQWTYVLEGHLQVTTRKPGANATSRTYGPHQVACEEPGTAHAWLALDDVTVLVFSKGPRSGEDYETDVFRMTGADRLIAPMEWDK